MKYKFPKRCRLTTEGQFKKVFGARKKITSEITNIYFCDNNTSHSRLGVIVPKKNIKKASRRNYLKRIIRENFRLKRTGLEGKDILIIVNSKKADTVEGKNLRTIINKQLSKIFI